jgi:hypothetical protein
MAKGPLSLVEFERRIQQDGYKPRSSNSRVYLRSVLLKAPDFVQIAPGRWIFKPFLRQG